MTNDALITLAIETSNPPARKSTSDVAGGAFVAIVRGNSAASHDVLAQIELDRSRSHDDALVGAIARACEESGLTPRDLTRIAVSVGPGGYTSLRIAVTVARTLARVNGAELVPVPTAHALASAARGKGDEADPMLVCLAWKRDDAWVQQFESGTAVDEGGIRTLHEIATSNARVIVADRRVLDAIAEINPDHDAAVRTPQFDPVSVALVSFDSPSVEAPGMNPLYPRAPEAVRVWEERTRA